MARKWPRILFFINDALATPEETEEAEALGFNVVFRNALHVAAEGALEACDGVAGEVPECYAKAFPSADEIVEQFKAGSAKAERKLGENPFDADTIKKISKVKTIEELVKFQVEGRSAEVEAAINAKGTALEAVRVANAAKAGDAAKPAANPGAAWTPNA